MTIAIAPVVGRFSVQKTPNKDSQCHWLFDSLPFFKRSREIFAKHCAQFKKEYIRQEQFKIVFLSSTFTAPNSQDAPVRLPQAGRDPVEQAP
jgi:hypothetical protein